MLKNISHIIIWVGHFNIKNGGLLDQFLGLLWISGAFQIRLNNAIGVANGRVYIQDKVEEIIFFRLVIHRKYPLLVLAQKGIHSTAVDPMTSVDQGKD